MPGSKLKYPYSILWGFTVHSPLRRNCIRLVEWEWFDRTSLILIVLNVITMMLSEPTRTEIVSIDYLFAWTDPMFSILFTFFNGISQKAGVAETNDFAGSALAFLAVDPSMQGQA